MSAPNEEDRILGNTLAAPFFETPAGKELLQMIRKQMERRAHALFELRLTERDLVIAQQAKRLAQLEDDNTIKTNELRTLNRNMSEERIARLVNERVDVATVALQNDLQAARREVAELTSKNQELAASKKKLREALDRTKERQ